MLFAGVIQPPSGDRYVFGVTGCPTVELTNLTPTPKVNDCPFDWGEDADYDKAKLLAKVILEMVMGKGYPEERITHFTHEVVLKQMDSHKPWMLPTDFVWEWNTQNYRPQRRVN